MIAACAYASLGGRARAFGLVGSDYFGNFMIQELQRFGVDTASVRVSDQLKTGITVNMVYGGTRTQITFPGATQEFREVDLELPALLGCGHVHFAGIYQQVGFRSSLTDLLASLRRAGVTTSLDCQWDQTEQWQGLDQWLPLTDVFFANAREARSMTSRDNPEEACRVLQDRTAHPLIKLGEEGALFLDRGRSVRIPAQAIQVVDATGAGDSFDAAFLFATFVRKMALVEAVRFAVAVGSRCCMFRGGVEARTTFADVYNLIRSQP